MHMPPSIVLMTVLLLAISVGDSLKLTANKGNMVFIPCFNYGERIFTWKINESIFYIGDLPDGINYHPSGLIVNTGSDTKNGSFICFSYKPQDFTLIKLSSVDLVIKPTASHQTNPTSGEVEDQLHLLVTEGNNLYIPCLGVTNPNDIHFWQIDDVNYSGDELPDHHIHHESVLGIIAYYPTGSNSQRTYQCIDSSARVIYTVKVNIIQTERQTVDLVDQAQDIQITHVPNREFFSEIVCLVENKFPSIDIRFDANHPLIVIVYQDSNQQCECPLFKPSRHARVSACPCFNSVELIENTLHFFNLSTLMNDTVVKTVIDSHTTEMNISRTIISSVKFVIPGPDPPPPRISVTTNIVCIESNDPGSSSFVERTGMVIRDITSDVLLQTEREGTTICEPLTSYPTVCAPFEIVATSHSPCEESKPVSIQGPGYGNVCNCLKEKATLKPLIGEVQSNSVTVFVRSTCHLGINTNINNPTISNLYIQAAANCTENGHCTSTLEVEFSINCEQLTSITVSQLLPKTTYNLSVVWKSSAHPELCIITYGSHIKTGEGSDLVLTSIISLIFLCILVILSLIMIFFIATITNAQKKKR